LAAWGPNDLVVMRGKFLAGPDPVVGIVPPTDVRAVDSKEKCFDQFAPYEAPKLWLTDTYLVLGVPGKCAGFYKFNLPAGEWNTATVTPFDPTDTNQKYVSSATFDSQTRALYYTIKEFNVPGATLFVYDTNNWTQPANSSVNLDIDEGEAVLTVGYDNNVTRSIYVAASGANVIKRWAIDEKYSFSKLKSAVVDPTFTQISSLLYISPYLYMTTYEPNAKILRILSSNFCDKFCGENGFCDGGNCKCKEGYTPDITVPTLPCTPIKQVQSEITGKQNEGAAAALGVLFAFSSVTAIAGWFLWWKSRQHSYSSVGGDSNL